MFSKIIDFVLSWWVVGIFLIIFINGLYVGNSIDWGNNFETYNAIGVASTVAIAFLAFVAYIQFSHSKFKTTRYQKWISTLSNSEKRAALLIRFGGKGASPESEMKGFVRHKLGIDGDQMMFKEFGKNSIVTKEDIVELKDFVKAFQEAFIHAEEVIVLIKGAGPAFAVCGDILGNWKPIKIYHYQGKYELWYASEKHSPKDVDNVNDKQIA